MGVAETVEEMLVALCAVGYADHVVEARLHECQRVHHALGDDDAVLSDAGIDVPGNQFTAVLHGKLLVGGLVLDVEDALSLSEGEGQTVALGAADIVFRRADACPACRLGCDAAPHQVVDGRGREVGEVGGHRQPPLLLLHRLTAVEILYLRADDESEAAVVALAEARAQVDPDTRFLAMATVLGTVGTGASHNVARTAVVGRFLFDIEFVEGYDVVARRCLFPVFDGREVTVVWHSPVFLFVRVPPVSRRRSSS